MNAMVRYLVGMALVSLFFAGCSGGHSGVTPASRTAGATVTIKWPARSRGIPVDAESVMVRLSDTSGFAATQSADRPTDGSPSTIHFSELPVGPLFVTAEAYPGDGATGAAQAAGSSSVVTSNGQSTPLSLTLASTIQTLALSPQLTTVNVGETEHLAATPQDAAGNTVLCLPEAITWNSTAQQVLAVDAYGNITGMTAGHATITATETESGCTASMTVTVQVGPNGTPLSATYQSNASVIPTDGSVPVSNVTSTSVTLSGVAPSLTPGTILINTQAPYFIRKVKDTRRTRSGDVVVDTTQAAIEDAFAQLDLDVTKTVAATDITVVPLDPNVVIDDTKSPTRFSADVNSTILAKTFNFSGLSVVPGVLTASGTVGVTLTTHFVLKIGLLKGVQELSATVTPTVNATVSLNASAGTNEPSQTYHHDFATISADVPVWGPIFITPEIKLGPSLTLSGETHLLTFSGQCSATIGCAFSGGAPSGIATFNSSYSIDSRVSSLTSSYSAQLVPLAIEGDVLIEDIAGPSVELDPYVEGILTPQSASAYSVDLRYGCSGSVGVTSGDALSTILKSVNIPDSWSYQLVDVSKSFSGFPCTYGFTSGGSGGGGGGGGGGTSATGGTTVTIN